MESLRNMPEDIQLQSPSSFHAAFILIYTHFFLINKPTNQLTRQLIMIVHVLLVEIKGKGVSIAVNEMST